MTNTELLPEEIRARMPMLSQVADKSIAELEVVCKWFYPDFGWTWYVIAWVEEDVFFGFVDGDFPELGDFRMGELLETRGKLGCAIERDLYFSPQPLQPIYDAACARAYAIH